MPNKSGQYRLTPLALSDLENIWLYTFRNWSTKQADSYHADIVKAFEGLASGHKIGRPVDVQEGYLKYAVNAHFIYYRHQDSGIIVARILHQRMDVSRHLNQTN